MCLLIQDAASSLSTVLSCIILFSTLAKTLSLKLAANRAGIKGNLITLLIRDGTMYLGSTLVLGILQSVLFHVNSRVPGIMVMIGPDTWLRPVLVLHMILALKTIDQVSMASLPEIHTSYFSSLHFMGNVGAPLKTLDERENEDEASNPEVSAKQVIENPLSIGLLDDDYISPSDRRERKLMQASEAERKAEQV
ncbi:hypothetical protein C8Q75DRAFT_288120 [Abortiporus biennis]|nr:hypothetical protein C8Q75DRAFT_288120 [Abortiporus biennis]